MEKNWFLNRSEELYEETVRHRRYIHQNAECGMHLPKTVEYVKKQLESFGYEPKDVAGGVVCTAGKGSRTILLRGDMDALPQKEETGLPFACGMGACHSCGHDTHTAMLLTAAKMLKEREDELENTVKFMFQPGEEVLQGARAMIQAGVLENPKVDCAVAFHCMQMETGRVLYGYGSTRAVAAFAVKVKGQEAHSGFPFRGVSAVSAAANILTTAQQIVNLELEPGNDDLLTFSVIQAGEAENIVAGEAVLKGTIRTYSGENLEYLKKRLGEIAENVGRALGVSVSVEYLKEVFSLKNDAALADECKDYLREVTENCVRREGNDPGSEDFAELTRYVPTVLFNIGLGSAEQGYVWGGHHPKRILDEEGMKVGAACYANCAFQWTRHRKEK